MNELVPIERIERKIHMIRGQKVMLDKDLSELYQVPTKVLNQAVKRNLERFPKDFMFQLNWAEAEHLRSQFVTLKNLGFDKRGHHLKFLPYAFTEQGVAMLSGLLNSPTAVKVNIAIMRTFVRLRQVLATNKDLTYLFKELRHQVNRHDAEIGVIIKTIEKMVEIEKKPKKRIGFLVDKKDGKQ